MYLSLIINDHEEHAKNFMDKFMHEQEDYYQEDLTILSFVTKKEHIKGNEIAEIHKY